MKVVPPSDAPQTPVRRWVMPAAVLAVAAALLLVLSRAVATPPATGGTPLNAQPAPDFRLATTSGEMLSLADLRGQVVLLNFWASWCIPCREEAPLLRDAARDHQARGLRVVGVLYQDGADAARDFERRYGITYPTVIDADGRTAIAYGVIGIPETFVIDREGVVRDRQIGPYTADGLAAKLDQFLR